MTDDTVLRRRSHSSQWRARRRRRTWIASATVLAVTAITLAALLVFVTGAGDRATVATTRDTAGARSPAGVTGRPLQVSPVTTTQPTAAVPTTTVAAPGSPLGAQVTQYLASRQGDVSASVLDLSTGQQWNIRPGDAQDTASIVKVDVMATLMAQETAAGQPIPEADQSLLSSMVEVSDNGSATTLWNAVGAPGAIDSFNRSIGMTDTTASTCLECAGFAWPGWGLTTTTAADQITLLHMLLFPSPQISGTDRSEAVNLLEHVTPSEDWGVSGGVPPGVTIALKNGWVPLADGLWQINSIGWIDGGGRDYLIAVLTDGNPTEQYGIDTINALSTDIWSALGAASGA